MPTTWIVEVVDISAKGPFAGFVAAGAVLVIMFGLSAGL